jgi:Uncharacterized protein conserved in bacteria (DUF2332)
VLPEVLAGLPAGASATVLTTWAFAYFTIEARHRFVDALRAESKARPITWLSAESVGVVDAFAREDVPHHDEAMANVLGAVTFEAGEGREDLLAFVHQHGNWIDWRATRGRG